MRVLFDTNVVLDVLLAREPHARHAAQLFAAVVDGALTGVVCATTITTLHYVAARAVGPRVAGELLDIILRLFEVAPVSGPVVLQARAEGGPDFQDSVIAVAAAADGVEVIVTRDPSGFRAATMPVMSPEELVGLLGIARDHVEIVSL